MRCPKCDKPMEYEEDEPDVGVNGGYYCEPCDEWVSLYDVSDDID